MVFRFFRRGGSAAGDAATPRTARRSSGLGEFTRRLSGLSELTVLDLGPTSPSNIQHFTGLGHRVYNEDVLLSSVDPQYLAKKDEQGKPVLDATTFLKENLKYSPQQFDAVLCWDVPDYLHEGLVKPLIDRLAVITKPGGVMLVFFHTKDAGPDVPYSRYHIAGPDSLHLLPGPQFRLQRAFNNRHIENLFTEFSSLKFFLTRDNVREVLAVR